MLDTVGNVLLSEAYYSIGGGFIQTAKEREAASNLDHVTSVCWPYPFSTATEMLTMARLSGKSIGSMKRENELVLRQFQEVDSRLMHLRKVMNSCIERGLKNQGQLPGGLKVKRRAADIFLHLKTESHVNSRLPLIASDWLAAYAMAVGEENAAGGQVVTAPTNEAVGIVPAVLRYYLECLTKRGFVRW